MAKTPKEPVEAEVAKKTYRVLKNFLFKARVYTMGFLKKGEFTSLAQFTDSEAAQILKQDAAAIKPHKGE